MSKTRKLQVNVKDVLGLRGRVHRILQIGGTEGVFQVQEKGGEHTTPCRLVRASRIEILDTPVPTTDTNDLANKVKAELTLGHHEGCQIDRDTATGEMYGCNCGTDAARQALAELDERAAESDELLRLAEQMSRDLNQAHDEMLRAQGVPQEQWSSLDWPEWTPQANSIRWAEKLLGKRLAKTNQWTMFPAPLSDVQENTTPLSETPERDK